MRRWVAFVLLVCSLAVVGLAPLPATAQAKPKPKVTLTLSETSTVAGNRVAFIGKVKALKPGSRVFLQEKRGAKWIQVGKGKTSPKRKYRITKRPAAGVRTYRVAVKATPRTRASHSKARTLTIYGTSTVRATASWGIPVEGTLTTLSGTVTAWTPGNRLVLQELVLGEWLPLRGVDISATGTFSVKVRPTSAWPTYRLSKPADTSSARANSVELHPRDSMNGALAIDGVPLSVPIAGAGPIARLTFAGELGDHISLGHSATAGAVVMALSDPDGIKMAHWGARENRLVLPKTGSYELNVYSVSATGSVNVVGAFTPITRVALNGPALPISQTVGSYVRFAATAGDLVHLGHPATCNTQMTKVGGDVEVDFFIQEPRPIWQIPTTGQYDVFVPLTCQAANVYAQTIVPTQGTPNTAGSNFNQSKPFQASALRFSLNAGTEYTLTPDPSKVDTSWVVKDPAGNNMGRSEVPNDPFSFVAANSGTYTAYAIPSEDKIGTYSADMCSARVVSFLGWGIPAAFDTGACDGRRVVVKLGSLSAGQVPGFSLTSNAGVDAETCRLRTSTTHLAVGSCIQASAATTTNHEFTFSENPANASATIVPWLVQQSAISIGGAQAATALTVPSQVAWLNFSGSANQAITVSAPSIVLDDPSANWQVTVRNTNGNVRLAAIGTAAGLGTGPISLVLPQTGTYRLTVTAGSPGTITTRVTSP
jgi:hypothetical protein